MQMDRLIFAPGVAMTKTGEANTLDDIIREIEETKISERGATRLDDQTSDAAMEDRKKGGYF